MEVSPTLSNPPEKSEGLLLALAVVAAFFTVARFLMELVQLIIDRKSYIRLQTNSNAIHSPMLYLLNVAVLFIIFKAILYRME